MEAVSARPKSPLFVMHMGRIAVSYPEEAKLPVLLREYLPSTVGLGVNDAIMCNMVRLVSCV